MAALASPDVPDVPGRAMTLLLALAALAWAFLLAAYVCEWVTEQLRRPSPGYRDTSRGTRRD